MSLQTGAAQVSLRAALRWLKLRTVAVGAAAAGMLMAASAAAVDALWRLGAQAPVAALHVPASASQWNEYSQLHGPATLFLLLAALAFSVMPMRPLVARAVLGVALFMGAMLALTTGPTTRLLGLLPSRLEYHLVRGDAAASAAALAASPLAPAAQRYVQAQFDLREGRLATDAGAAANLRQVLAICARVDQPGYAPRPIAKAVRLAPEQIPEIREALSQDPDDAVRTYGGAAIDAADPYHQFGNPLPVQGPEEGENRAAERFDPAVVHALRGGAMALPPTHVRSALASAAAMALLGASLALALLWQRMGARVRRLDIMLTYGDLPLSQAGT